MSLSLAVIIVVALRLILPLSIFRWRIGGAIGSMVLDGFDVVLVDILANIFQETPGFGTHYQLFDKWLDMYYLTFEFIVSLWWTSKLARNTSIFLFVFRFVGLIAFEITGIRKLFFFFPNLFENFYLYYVIAVRYFPRLVPKTFLHIVIILGLLYIPKFGQEWLLHYQQAQPWLWLKNTFRVPL